VVAGWNTALTVSTIGALYLNMIIRLIQLLVAMLALSALPSQAAAEHVISHLSRQNDGEVTLELMGAAPVAYRNYYDLFPLEISNDLTQWTPWMTLLRTNRLTDAIIAVDDTASGLEKRFYRTPTNLLITPIPRPTGAYTVGTVCRLFTDPSSSNRYNIKTNSSFVVQFWYPGMRKAGVLPARYLDAPIAPIWREGYSFFGLGANSILFQNAYSHALAEIPIATNETYYPVVLFSHGYQCVRTINTDVMANLASHGYIAIAVDHFDAWVSLFPDGRVVRGNAPNLPVSVAQNIYSLQSRRRDLQLILDELSQLNASDSFFRGRLDLQRIGIFGHSLGGAATADLCATEPRIKAGLSLDGGGHTNLLALNIKQPFLIASGPNDPTRPYRAEFRSLFDQLGQDAFWLRLRNSEHFDFVESPWFAVSPQPTKVRIATILRQYVLSFFNKYLKKENDHLLDGPPTDYPEVDSFLWK
jgi:dienelactone hydrolase